MEKHLSRITDGSIKVSSLRPENIRKQIRSLDCAVAQSLNFQTSFWGDAKTPMAPAGNCSLAHAHLGGQGRASVLVYERSKSSHVGKFRLAKPPMQDESTETLNHVKETVLYNSSMNTPWQVKAKTRMRDLQITQNFIAEQLDVTKGTVSNWFSGRNQPPLSKLRRLAQVIDISFADLVSEDDAICRSLWELEILRTLREIPEPQQAQASLLISTLAKTLLALPPPPPILTPPPVNDNYQ